MNIFDELRRRIESFLRAEAFIVGEKFRRSTRGVGDAIEGLIVEEREDWLWSFAGELRGHYSKEARKIESRVDYLEAFIERKLG